MAEKYLGRPCKNGHSGLRYRSGRNCVECVAQAAALRRETMPLLVRDQARERKRRERERHPEKNRQSCESYRKRNLDLLRAKARSYARKNYALKAVYQKSYSTEYARRFRGRVNAKAAAYRAARLSQTPKWADLNAIRDFYERCPQGFHVDHIIPLRGTRIRGLHVLENLQYLPARENLSKGNRWNGS